MKNIHNKINSNEYKFYLKEEKYFNEPKFSTKIFLDKISNISEKKLTFVDVGCANGALLSYIENNIPNWNLVGIDIDDELIKDAIDRQLSANFFVLDFLLPNQVPIKADIVHAAGIINIFKDPKAFIDSLINIANPKATIFIHGIFNPYDIDVQVSYTDYSRSNIKSNSPFNGRWNNYSIRTISDILNNNKKVEKYKFIAIDFPHNMSIKGDENDLHRSWTIKCDDKVQFTNGLNIIQHQYWLEVELN